MKTALKTALVIALVAQAWFVWRDVRYDADFREGVRAYNRADVAHVRERFAAARAIDDDDPYLWAWTGDAALYEFDYLSDGATIDPVVARELLDEAWSAYGKSVARSPAYSWSWMGLSRVALRRERLARATEGLDLGRFSKLQQGLWDPTLAVALTAASTALELSPHGFLQLDVLAEVHTAAGQQERAAELLTRSATVMPAPPFHPWGTRGRLDRRSYGAVLAALEEGLSRAPAFEHPMLHIEVGRFARAQGDLSTALRHFELADETSEGDFRRRQALWEQSLALQETGEFADAIAATQAALAAGFAPDPAHRRLAVLLRLVGRFDEACSEYRSIRPSAAEAEAWAIAGAQACESAGRLRDAERLLGDGLVTPSDQPRRARALIELYVRNGRISSATSTLTRWIRDFDGKELYRRWAVELGVPVEE